MHVFFHIFLFGLVLSLVTQDALAQPLSYMDYKIPEKMDLCGEKIPLDKSYARQMLDRELTIAAWDTAQVFMWLKRAGKYFPAMDAILKQAGAPADLKYLAIAESSLITYVRSPKGALGTWQFMAATGKRQGLRKTFHVDERLSFTHSTKAAVKYLNFLKKKFGSWTLAMAAYNCGEARVTREIEQQEVRDFFRMNLPTETERYVFRIAAIKLILENPQSYGFNLPASHAYAPDNNPTVKITTKTALHFTDLAKAVGMDFKDIKELNPQYLGYYLPVGTHEIVVFPGKEHAVKSAVKKLARASDKRKTKMRYYVVKRGDTLSGISRHTGVSMSTLRRMNGLSGSLIKIGQKLAIGNK